MIPPRLLSEDEFRACFAAPMRNVTAEADAQVDIWPYVDALDPEALGVPSLDDVRHVYRDANGSYDQVLIGTGRFDVLLAIVIDRKQAAILGHRLLDLNLAYGTGPGHQSNVR